MMYPRAPSDLWPRMAAYWRAGLHTLDIARLCGCRECAIYNSIPLALSAYPKE